MSPIAPFRKVSLGIIFCLTLLAGIYQPALADGIIIPDPPPLPDPIALEDSWLTIRYHRVSVSIEDQVAVTRVDQEFVNQHDWEAEGTYIFPIPPGAAISKFVMWVDGIASEGTILPADQARRIYEDIVRQRRDPALLEYVGQDAVRARIFPIPAGGSRRIELEYTQVLESQDGLVSYRYPLNTEKFSARALENCSIRVEIRSQVPLRGLYSPSHQDRIFVERQGDRRAVVGYEEDDVLPDQDFELIYTVSQKEIGLNLMVYPDGKAGSGLDQEGYFLVIASPAVKAEGIIPRDIVLVLDTSGSMEGDKLSQAKDAASYVLTHLNPEDRFNVIAFSTGLEHFSYDLQPRARAGAAVSWLERLPALGGTNINLALLEAISLQETAGGRPERPLVVLFLTDGLPTEGITDVGQILTNVAATAGSSLRLFAFGVGDDVNTDLLDTLATENRGLVGYVRPGETIDEEVSGLFARIQAPVLTDLALDFGDVLVDEIYPPVLPDLYSGGQLTITGRYRLAGESSAKTHITLSGQVNARQETFSYPADFSPPPGREPSNEFIARLWATRKIGYLLGQIRHQGENQEWVDAIVQLSLRYGIITPYTSFLIEEHDILGGEGWDQAADELLQSYSGPAVGAEAVGKSEAESNLRSAESIPGPGPAGNSPAGEPGQPQVRYVAGRTFLFREGIWVDSQYDPGSGQPLQIGFGSEPYFDLITLQPELAKILALGEQVIFLIQGQAYQITSGEGELSSLPADLISVGEASPDRAPAAAPSGLPALCSLPLLVGLILAGWSSRNLSLS